MYRDPLPASAPASVIGPTICSITFREAKRR
jgi:hypothetical protein